MQSDRKFTRTVFHVTVISEGDYNPTTLKQIVRNLGARTVVGSWGTESSEVLDEADAAVAVSAMGADMDFFASDDDLADDTS